MKYSTKHTPVCWSVNYFLFKRKIPFKACDIIVTKVARQTVLTLLWIHARKKREAEIQRIGNV
jgi:hypothetical protein